MKNKMIGSLIASAIIKALDITQTQINKIKNDLVRKGLTSLVEPLKSLVRALSDKDPNNDAQVAEIFREYANTGLSNFAEENLLTLSEKIKDAKLRRSVAFVIDPSVDMLRLVTDKEPDNEKQIAERWKQAAADPTFHDLVVNDWLEDVLDAMKVNEVYKLLIMETILAALQEATGGNLTPEQKEGIIITMQAKIAAKLAA